VSEKSIRERLIVPESLLENLRLGKIDKDDRLDLGERLLPREQKCM